MPRSKLAPDDPRNQTFPGTNFRVWEVERDSRLTPIVRRLNYKFGDGNWGLKEVAEDMVLRAEGKIGLASRRDRERNEKRQSVKERLESYLETFRDPTPNDLQSLTALCNLEIQMEGIDDRRLTELKLTVDEEVKLGQLYTKLSTEHRQLQTALGIDRGSRETEVDAAAEWKKLVQGASEKIKEVGIEIRCPHCKDEMNLNQGLVLFHFKGSRPWRWESVCANLKCGRTFTLQSLDWPITDLETVQ